MREPVSVQGVGQREPTELVWAGVHHVTSALRVCMWPPSKPNTALDHVTMLLHTSTVRATACGSCFMASVLPACVARVWGCKGVPAVPLAVSPSPRPGAPEAPRALRFKQQEGCGLSSTLAGEKGTWLPATRGCYVQDVT